MEGRERCGHIDEQDIKKPCSLESLFSTRLLVSDHSLTNFPVKDFIVSSELLTFFSTISGHVSQPRYFQSTCEFYFFMFPNF